MSVRTGWSRICVTQLRRRRPTILDRAGTKIAYFRRPFSRSHFLLKNFSRDARTRDAIFMIINAYSQLDDFKGLIDAAKQLEKTRGLADDDRKAIRDLSRRAQLKDLQIAAGDFGSKEYAENLKNLASKYKDSSMGSAALYEAFTSLRSKRDPELYDVGEALLEKHSDSAFTKEVVSSMAQTALITADFERAARYLSRFSDKYPG
jgi:outer membrane protein assembly factor BamD (BamD/ComL family)